MCSFVLSPTDMLGHWDVCGLSAADPCLRMQISVRTMPKDIVVPFTNRPHVSVRGDNTMQISNDGVA